MTRIKLINIDVMHGKQKKAVGQLSPMLAIVHLRMPSTAILDAPPRRRHRSDSVRAIKSPLQHLGEER